MYTGNMCFQFLFESDAQGEGEDGTQLEDDMLPLFRVYLVL